MVHECFVLRKTENLFYIFKIYWFYTWIIKKNSHTLYLFCQHLFGTSFQKNSFRQNIHTHTG